MLPFLSILTGLVILAAMARAYYVNRDPLHPLMYLGPLMIFAYAYKPIVLDWAGHVDRALEPAQAQWTQLINLIGVTCFCIGAMWRSVPAAARVKGLLAGQLSAQSRHRAVQTAVVLGLAAVIGFWGLVLVSGGLFQVYGRAYGGVATASGYLGELPLLAYPAIALLFIAWSGTRFGLAKIALIVLFASPQLVHGILGARRGPTFLIISALLLGAYAVAPRRPKLITVLSTIAALGVLLLVLVANRDRIYLGSTALSDLLEPRERERTVDIHGEDWIFSAGAMLTSVDSNTHFWGARYVCNFFVRPIPRQIWPDKYADMGVGWLDDQQDMLGMTDREWLGTVGWVPARGAAIGLIADAFLEFWYFGFLVCFVVGWFYNFLWRNMATRGGVWLLLYIFAAILSIYVPTQGVTEAWLYRFAFLALPTLLIWRLYIDPGTPLMRQAGGAVTSDAQEPKQAAPQQAQLTSLTAMMPAPRPHRPAHVAPQFRGPD